MADKQDASRKLKPAEQENATDRQRGAENETASFEGFCNLQKPAEQENATDRQRGAENETASAKYVAGSQFDMNAMVATLNSVLQQNQLMLQLLNNNKITLRDNFPLPLIEDQLDQLKEKTYFTLLDLKSAFHHITVEPSSVKYTSFVTPKKHILLY
ncbi:Reverse transcriptase (RNA-dependent DNA polymerase) [Popillia japonica]|uniref:Reverse transcriptase (RNA-dependent DNA polymerase) n=1 Tax=Popillia japonica TaxID=7064 RepID=A0AAW1MIS0_POPJA